MMAIGVAPACNPSRWLKNATCVLNIAVDVLYIYVYLYLTCDGSNGLSAVNRCLSDWKNFGVIALSGFSAKEMIS